MSCGEVRPLRMAAKSCWYWLHMRVMVIRSWAILKLASILLSNAGSCWSL